MDVNEYGLDLEFNLVTNAHKVLGQISDELAALQSQFSDAATKILPDWDDVTTDISEQFEKIFESVESIGIQAVDFIPGLDKIFGTSEDINTAHQGILESLVQVATAGLEINDVLGISQTLLAGAFTESSGLMGSWEAILGAWRVAPVLLTGIVIGLAAITLAVNALREAWKALIADEERFVTLNYRLYGTQRQLVEQVNLTTQEYGLFRDVVMEAYEHLAGGLRIPQEELGKYIKTVAEFNRTTAVSITNTANWMRSMRLAGYELVDINRGIQNFETYMRSAGATSEEVGNLVQQQASHMAARVAIFGQEGAKVANEQEAAMAALYRQYGMNVDVMLQMNRSIENNAVAFGALRSLAVNYAQTHSDITMAELEQLSQRERAWLGQQHVLQQYHKVMSDTTRDAASRLIEGQALLAVTQGAITKDQADQFHSMWLAAEAAGEDTTNLWKQQLDQLKEFQEAAKHTDFMTESMNTIAAQWNRITSSMQAAWQNLAMLGAPLFVTFMGVLEALANILGEVINIVTALGKVVLIAFSPFLSILNNIIIPLSKGIVDGIGTAFQPLINVIDALYRTVFGGSENLNKFQGAVYALGKAIGFVAGIIGVALTPIGWIGSAIMAASWAVQLLYDNIEDLRASSSVWNAIATAVEWVSGTFSTLWAVVTGVQSAIYTFITEALTAHGALEFLGGIIDVVSWGLTKMGDALRYVVEWFGANGAGVIEESQMAADALSRLAPEMQSITDIGYNLASSLAGVANAALNAASSLITGFSDNTLKVMDSVADRIASWFEVSPADNISDMLGPTEALVAPTEALNLALGGVMTSLDILASDTAAKAIANLNNLNAPSLTQFNGSGVDAMIDKVIAAGSKLLGVNEAAMRPLTVDVDAVTSNLAALYSGVADTMTGGAQLIAQASDVEIPPPTGLINYLDELQRLSEQQSTIILLPNNALQDRFNEMNAFVSEVDRIRDSFTSLRSAISEPITFHIENFDLAIRQAREEMKEAITIAIPEPRKIVNTEAIAKVQVITERDPRSDDRLAETTMYNHAKQTLDVLMTIAALIKEFPAGDDRIRQLLEDYLPYLEEMDSGQKISTGSMNNWRSN